MTSRSAMQREPAVAVGSSQRPWVAELMSYAQDHAGVRVVGTVLSGREAIDQVYDVLLIDDTTSYLTKRLIDRVQALRRIVIGVYESTRGETGKSKLVDMGVDAVIDAESTPKEFLARIQYLTEQRLVDRDFVDIVADEPAISAERIEPSTPPLEAPHGSGSVIAVSGSNGVTEVSIGLAAAIGRRGLSSTLIDLDTLEPVLAQRLGIELSPNVLTAIEQLRHTGTSGEVTLTHPDGFSVLAGLPSPREWEACPPDAASDLVAEAARGLTHAVVRVNRHLEDLSPFGVRSGRFGVARRLVADADELVVVGDPSPAGVTAILAWIGEARALSSSPIHVVLNHCGRSLYQRGEMAEEIGRTFRSASVSFAPEDHRVQKAAWQGEVTPQGRLLRSLDQVVDTLVGSARAGGSGVAR